MLIVDVGSLWGTTLDDAKTAVGMLKKAGVTYIKFQFCRPENGNIPLPYEFFEPLLRYGNGIGANISCSIWDDAGFHTLKNSGARWVKLAHSSPRKWVKPCMDAFPQLVLTNRLGEKVHAQTGRINLWTYEASGCPQYPVTAEVDHRNMYPPYDGYSCHSRSPDAVLDAHRAGASVIEVHGNPLGVEGPPDSLFALTLDQTKIIVKGMHNDPIRHSARQKTKTKNSATAGTGKNDGVAAAGVPVDRGTERVMAPRPEDGAGESTSGVGSGDDYNRRY